MTKETRIKVEEKIPITGQGFTLGKLLDGTECKILLDTGASKSYMSKSYYLRCKSLHALPQTGQTENHLPTQTGIKQPIGPRIENRPIPFYPNLTPRLPPRLPDLKETRRYLLDLDTDRNIDLKKILHTNKV